MAAMMCGNCMFGKHDEHVRFYDDEQRYLCRCASCNEKDIRDVVKHEITIQMLSKTNGLLTDALKAFPLDRSDIAEWGYTDQNWIREWIKNHLYPIVDKGYFAQKQRDLYSGKPQLVDRQHELLRVYVTESRRIRNVLDTSAGSKVTARDEIIAKIDALERLATELGIEPLSKPNPWDL